MSKATETQLTELHGVIAKVLTAQISRQEALTSFDEDGAMVTLDEMVYTASPAVVSAAIKFLKDNQISADIETNEDLSNLKDVLAKKQKHSRSAAEAAEQLAKRIDER
jgi:hypothetical protein